MPRKLSLDLDTLSVESFDTAARGEREEGTVRGHVIDEAEAIAAAKPCTCARTCLCPSNYYYCGTGPATIYSCDYTANASCLA